MAHLDDEYHDVRSNDLSSAASALKPSITIISDSPLLYSNGTDNNKNRVIDYFRDAGVHLDDESLEELPTWSQIESLIGDKPILLGAERCEDFRDKVPPLRRMLGSSGMFNSGTNLVSVMAFHFRCCELVLCHVLYYRVCLLGLSSFIIDCVSTFLCVNNGPMHTTCEPTNYQIPHNNNNVYTTIIV